MSAVAVKPRAYSVNAFCALFGVSRTTAYKMMTEGQIAYVMVCGRRRIPATEVDRIVGAAKAALL